MGILLYNFLFYVAGFVCCLSAVLLPASAIANGRAGRGKARAQEERRAKAGGFRKRWLILLLVSGLLAAFALPRTDLLPTTIGQLADEIKAAAEQSPSSLIYRESIGAQDSFVARVDDPAVAEMALDVLLIAAVDRRGCQLDMTRLQCEEYCFVFDGEIFSFRFVPGSYFCHDGQYHALGENRLNGLRDLLYENYAVSDGSEAA